MAYEQKHKAKTKSTQSVSSQAKLESGNQTDPATQKRTELRQAMQPLVSTPIIAQRRAVSPLFQAISLQHAEEQSLSSKHESIQRQIDDLGEISKDTLGQALQRQVITETPLPIIKNPRTIDDLVTVMRQRAAATDGQRMGERDRMHFNTLQRHVAANINQAYRKDRQSSEARNNQYGEMLASLHDHPGSQRVSTAVLGMVPKRDQPRLQRALDEALQRKQEQAALDEKALALQALQRKQSELQQEAEQSILERLQVKRGGGSSLPASVRKHLEQGLNADLSKVRIHNDTEADKLAKSVNAIAFTTGQDIFFQSGKYDPNSQTGLELLAHEVTHTVQQGKGKVPKGIDPDVGLEQEAQAMGKKLSTQSPQELKASSFPQPQSQPHKTDKTSPSSLGEPSTLQKAAQQIQAGSPIQPSKLRSMVLGEKPTSAAIQRAWWNPIDWAKAGIEKAKEVLMQALQEIPGYKQVCQVFGKDLATGKPLEQKADSIMETIASWMPGPVRDVIKALKETNVIGKAWEWFQGEFSKLNIAGLLGEIKNSIIKLPPSISQAVDAVTSRVDQVKQLIVGSGQKLAEIGHTGLTALISSDLGKKVVNGLSGGFETIIDIFKNPLRFVGHLFGALKGGFQSFSSNAGTHLKNGVGKWLTGSTGIAFPTTLNAAGLFMTAISVIGFGYNNLRPKLVKSLGKDGEKKIAFAEKSSDGALSGFKTMKSGIHKAREMKSSRKNIGGTVVKNVVGTVTKTIVTAAITKLATMLIPGGGFIAAIVGAFNTIQAIIDQGKNIASMIGSALSGVQAIAKGQVGGAVKLVESTLAKGIPIALAFLSRIIGAGNIGGKIKQVIQKAKDSLNKVLDKIVKRMAPLINRVAGKAMNAADKVRGFVGNQKEAVRNTAKATLAKGTAFVKDGTARVRNRLRGRGRAKGGQVDTLKSSPRKETGGNQNQVDTSKRNKELPEKEKKAKLDKAVAAIKPQFNTLIGRSPKVSEVNAQLQAWKREFKLTSLSFDQSKGEAGLYAKINPKGKAGSAYLFNIADDNTLRRLTKLVAHNLLAEPKVQAKAREMRRRNFLLRKKGDYLGSKQSPIKLQSGLALLAQISYWRSFGKPTEEYPVPGRMPPIKANGKPGRDRYHYYSHSETPEIVSAAQPQFNPNNEHVKGGGHYLEGKRSIIEKIKNMNSRGLSDKAIAIILLGLIRGESPIGFKSTEITALKSLKQMLFSSESKRSTENISNAAMLVTRVSRGDMTWQSALENLPMHPVGAEAAKRELGRKDQQLNAPDPNTLAAKIADLEAKVTREYIKLMSEDKGFVLKTFSQAQRLVEREMRKFYGI